MIISEKIRFIYTIIEEKIIINKRNKADIEKQLIEHDFKPLGSSLNSEKDFKYY